MKIKNVYNPFSAVVLASISGSQSLAKPYPSQGAITQSASQTRHDDFINQGVQGETDALPAAELRAAPTSIVQRALKCPILEIGYKEQPLGRDSNKFSRYFCQGSQPWCANYVSWQFNLNGKRKLPWPNVSAVSSILVKTHKSPCHSLAGVDFRVKVLFVRSPSASPLTDRLSPFHYGRKF